MDFEMTSHFFPLCICDVYNTLLDIELATFKHCIYSGRQLITEHWDLSLIQVGGHRCLRTAPHSRHFLAYILEMWWLCLMRHIIFFKTGKQQSENVLKKSLLYVPVRSLEVLVLNLCSLCWPWYTFSLHSDSVHLCYLATLEIYSSF